MKITSVETVVTSPPIRHAGLLGVGALEQIDLVIVRVNTDGGIVGVGEASPWPVFSDNAFAIKETIDRYLAPAIIGRSPSKTRLSPPGTRRSPCASLSTNAS